MSKAQNNPMRGSDLTSFVQQNSDFAFEMRVLKQLRDLGFECSHAATYSDPVTNKIRQFDIRAIRHTQGFTLALAVECKNLRPNMPLLLSAVPRASAEAFHELIIYDDGLRNCSAQSVEGKSSIYKPGNLVGKKTDQVGKDGSGNYFSNDEATFEKMNQAVNSCRDLIKKFERKLAASLVRAIVPLLVVPEGVLWQVEYDLDGNITENPHQVNHSTLFIDHSWHTGHSLGMSYRVSHIEFVVSTALPDVIEKYFGEEGFFKAYFWKTRA